MLGSDYADQNCSIARALEVVGERWTLLVLRDLFVGIRRFDELVASLGVTRTVLARRLAHLVEEGVVERRRYQERPARLLLHRGCGGRLDGHLSCERCGVALQPDDVEARPGAVPSRKR